MRLGAIIALSLAGCGGFLGFGDDGADDAPSPATPPGSDGGDDSSNVSTGTGEVDGGGTTDAATDGGGADACSGATCTRRVFVTNATYDGNLGGIAGADQKCQLAGDLFIPGRQWKAWVSIMGGAVNQRFSMSDGPYVTGSAQTVVANDWAGFASNAHLARILSELDAPPSDNGELAWSGTDQGGTDIGTDCDGWTSNLSSTVGVVGNASALDLTWTNVVDPQPCNRPLHLYCVEQ